MLPEGGTGSMVVVRRRQLIARSHFLSNVHGMRCVFALFDAGGAVEGVSGDEAEDEPDAGTASSSGATCRQR
jgi:hypothetical protein